VEDDLSVDVDFFFFQAEDGIRDFHVTGVQTCALPIYRACSRAAFCGKCSEVCPVKIDIHKMLLLNRRDAVANHLHSKAERFAWKIGRASCRERVLIWGRAASLKIRGEARM